MMRTQDHHNHEEAQQSRVFYELSSLVLNILRSPPSPGISFSDVTTSTFGPYRRRRRSASPSLPPQITPAGFASLMLGISLALMFCGSVTFFIGFMLLPWVIGFVMVFYFVGLVSSISLIGRAVLCYATAPSSPSSPRKDLPAWKFL